MRDPKIVLNHLSSFKVETKITDIYKNLYNPEFYRLAYQNIKSKEDLSDKTIDDLINNLRNKTYKPVSLKNKVPPIEQRLVEEIISMILERLYWFLPNRTPHTALKYLKESFDSTKWWLVCDLKGHLNEINHGILLDTLKEKIREQKFVSLINKFLKAGYIDQWEYNCSYSGEPRGTRLGQILSNIYLNRLDKYIENLISNETDYKINYVRYADSFLVGLISSKKYTLDVQNNIQEFITNDLRMELNKNELVHNSEPIEFLGYNISIMRNEHRSDGKVSLYIDHEIMKRFIIDNKFGKFVCDSKTGKPKLKGIHRTNLINLDEFKILNYYNSKIKRIYSYYKLATNLDHKFSNFMYIVRQSFLRTLASKYKTSCAKLLKNKNYHQHKRVGVTYNTKFYELFKN